MAPLESGFQVSYGEWRLPTHDESGDDEYDREKHDQSEKTADKPKPLAAENNLVLIRILCRYHYALRSVVCVIGVFSRENHRKDRTFLAL